MDPDHLALPCSIRGWDPMILAPPVHPRILQVVKMRGNQKDQSQGLEKRRKRSASQEPSTPVLMMKRLLGLCHFLNSLEAWRTDGVIKDYLGYPTDVSSYKRISIALFFIAIFPAICFEQICIQLLLPFQVTELVMLLIWFQIFLLKNSVPTFLFRILW